ncbi:g10951 [Coccomyxa viridis]|uniref:G10951 protein n=1 Tax=Coccomyxa viridis TaxID=1274662 RepID=A0ABP1GDR0_9CHLO
MRVVELWRLGSQVEVTSGSHFMPLAGLKHYHLRHLHISALVVKLFQKALKCCWLHKNIPEEKQNDFKQAGDRYRNMSLREGVRHHRGLDSSFSR